MSPIRVAIIFDQQIHAGGGYQQSLNASLLVKQLSEELVEPIYFTIFKENITILSKFDIEAQFLNITLFEKFWARIRISFRNHRLLKFIKKIQRYGQFEKTLVQNKIDLVYFLAPSTLAQSLEEINYIVTVWDLCHRDDPEFPEVRVDRQFEVRDLNYNSILPRATAILVDSELGKENVIRRYGIDQQRVHVMPFQASVSSRFRDETTVTLQGNILAKFNLDTPYVIYPAQFWAHKNHVYLLKGLKELESLYGIKIGAIFCGGNKGNKKHVEKYAQELRVDSRVIFAGFVTNEEMISLYQQSLALVMPTYFGPTNLPPLEAFELGVPVLYSDMPGLRDQVGDAALLMNLKDPKTMANHLKNLIKQNGLRDQLVKNGRNRLILLNEIDRVKILESIIEDFHWRRLCWE